MKFFKLLFSRAALVSFAIVLEFLFIALTFTYWSDVAMLIRIFLFGFEFIVFLYLINNNKSPDSKIPWIIVILAFPIFGMILFVLISRNLPSKKQMKLFNLISENKNKYINTISKENLEKEKELKQFRGIENYLKNTTLSNGYFNNDVKFFNLGEPFYESLLEDLKKAKKFIFIEYFIIENGEMWNGIHKILLDKVRSGVEVRVMYDDMGTAGILKSNFYKSLRKEGIDCVKFNTFKPFISGIHNNRDHRKIVVIDGNIGYTGGINIADQYINKVNVYGHWNDSAIRIEGTSVKNLTYMFLQLFDMNKKTFSDYDKYLNVKCKTFENNGYIHPFGSGPCLYNEELVAENNYINMINSAQKRIYVTTPYLITSYNLINALRNAAFKGVDVRIITPHHPDKKIVFGITRSSYKFLLEAGVKIYEYTPGFMHSKQMIVDDDLAFVGTINLDYRSLVHHYECGAIIYKHDALKDISKDFDDIISVSEEQTIENIKINKFTRLINSLLAMFRPLF